MYPQGMTGTEVSPRDGTAQIDNPGCGFAGGSWSTLAGAKPADIGFVATLESLGPEPLTLRLR